MKINREAKVFSNPVATTVFFVVLGVSVYLGYLVYPLIKPLIFVSLAGMALAFFLATAVRIADQWEKAVVLRMGKYRGLKGPGFFLIIPIIDQVDSYVDQRLRVTDISAEKTLTKDTVPVTVDAIVYWTVWDVEKSALEVQQYADAVSYVSLTGLRDVIGKHDLADLLQHRDQIAKGLQQYLDEDTNPWGITCNNVGIKDIIIPTGLSNAMSKQAQAERERQARVILGTAETEIAEKFAMASERYMNNPVALQLRGMNMLFEGLKDKGSLMIVPSSALESMNIGALGGLTALAETQAAKVKTAARLGDTPD